MGRLYIEQRRIEGVKVQKTVGKNSIDFVKTSKAFRPICFFNRKRNFNIKIFGW